MNKYVIGKELIKNVFITIQKNVKEVLDIKFKGKLKNVIVVKFVDSEDLKHEDGYVSSELSYYVSDFTFLIKKWAAKNNFSIVSGVSIHEKSYSILKTKNDDNFYSASDFNEVQSIINVGEYLLNELEAENTRRNKLWSDK